MVEHEGKKVPSFAADGKGAKDMKTKASMAEKDKYCMKNFGKKYSECSAKQKAQCDKAHGKVEKSNEMCPECGKEKNKMGCMKMGCGGKMGDPNPSDDEMASRDHERDFQNPKQAVSRVLKHLLTLTPVELCSWLKAVDKHAVLTTQPISIYTAEKMLLTKAQHLSQFPWTSCLVS